MASNRTALAPETAWLWAPFQTLSIVPSNNPKLCEVIRLWLSRWFPTHSLLPGKLYIHVHLQIHAQKYATNSLYNPRQLTSLSLFLYLSDDTELKAVLPNWGWVDYLNFTPRIKERRSETCREVLNTLSSLRKKWISSLTIWEDWIPFSSDRTLSPYCCYAATHTLKHKLIQADLTGSGGCD